MEQFWLLWESEPNLALNLYIFVFNRNFPLWASVLESVQKRKKIFTDCENSRTWFMYKRVHNLSAERHRDRHKSRCEHKNEEGTRLNYLYSGIFSFRFLPPASNTYPWIFDHMISMMEISCGDKPPHLWFLYSRSSALCLLIDKLFRTFPVGFSVPHTDDYIEEKNLITIGTVLPLSLLLINKT